MNGEQYSTTQDRDFRETDLVGRSPKSLSVRSGGAGFDRFRLGARNCLFDTSHLASYDGAAELDRFLDLLLPGLTATLTHPDK